MPTQDIGWLHPNAQVLLKPDGFGQEWLGHIDRIGNIIDERSQSVKAYIKLDDTGDIKPLAGVFLKVDIEALTIPNALKLERRAVYEEAYVFLVEAGQFSRREVNIAFDEGDFYIIDSGLSNGDTLVTELLQGVSAGMPARSRDSQSSGN